MRDLKECQAEVFRRSEKRIRRRRRILTACLPLVLCGAVLPFVWTEGFRGGMEGTVIEGAPEYSVEIAVARIEVSGAEGIWSYTNEADLLAISAGLDSYLPGAIPEEHRVLESEESVDGEDLSDRGYTITVIMNDGSVAEYYLSGNCLENRTGGGISNLTQSAARELKELLGIPVQ